MNRVDPYDRPERLPEWLEQRSWCLDASFQIDSTFGATIAEFIWFPASAEIELVVALVRA